MGNILLFYNYFITIAILFAILVLQFKLNKIMKYLS